jgi:tRNA(fMet)-specific endonuclease VapC
MNGKYLLDTNIIAFFQGDEASLKRVGGADVYVPTIVVGELVYGALNADRQSSDLNRIYTFIDDAEILDCDIAVAEAYGAIKAAQRRKGRPLPENDLWIAATAQRHNLTLVTRDAHFQEIEGIAVASW